MKQPLKVKGLIYLLSAVSTVAAYATNPASQQYVDTLVTQLQSQLQLQAGQIGAQIGQLQSAINTQGVPPGGTTGRFLVKASNDNYDTQWVLGPGPYVVGQQAFGGVVFFVHNDPVTGVQTGLVAATADETGPGNYQTWAQALATCAAKADGGYTWFLPNLAQISTLFSTRLSINPNDQNGGFAIDNGVVPNTFPAAYWSSSQPAPATAHFFQRFDIGEAGNGVPDATSLLSIRCIHAFTA